VIPECDVLAPQSFRMAERLRYAGVPTRTLRYPGATHSFLEAASIAALSRRALADSSAWLREQLADAATPDFASSAIAPERGAS
jgi:acetyl esterase